MSYRQSVSFLIVCAVRLELEALAKKFQFKTDKPNEGIVPGSSSVYFFEFGGKKLVVMQITRQGVLSAACETAHALQHVEPACVVSFGIAGKLGSDNDVELKDVVFADSVAYYEPVKETVETKRIAVKGKMKSEKVSTFLPRTEPFPVDPRLRNILLGLPSGLWTDFRVRTGPIASGEKLIEDMGSVTRTRIKKSVRDKSLAVEMEAAGVAAAVEWFQPLNADQLKPTFMALKGVSDDAAEGKKKQNKTSKGTKSEEHPDRISAATNAAQVLAEIIRQTGKAVIHQPVKDTSAQTKGIIEDVNNALQPIGAICEPAALGRLLYTAKGRRIPVFYHWEQRTPELHWMDLLHLTVLGQFPLQYFQPRPLVSIISGVNPSPSLGQEIEMICKVQPTFSNRMIDERETSVVRAKSLGWDQGAFLDALQKYTDSAGQIRGSQCLDEWMQYIISESGNIGGCVVLVWKRRTLLYEALFHSFAINSCLVFSDDILLGGKKGKFEDPGQGLIVEPGVYSAIREWAKTAEINHALEFASLFSHDVKKWLSESGEPPIRTPSQSNPSDIINEVIAAWEHLYFKNDVARAT